MGKSLKLEQLSGQRLQPGHPLTIFPKTVQRFVHGAVGQDDETDNADIEARYFAGSVNRRFYFPFGLDTYKPEVSVVGYCDVFSRSQGLPAVEVAYP